MINPWCRLWNDMPSDPKWRTIAKISGQRIGDVIAVFNFLMVNANTNATERGRTHNFNTEDVASALDMEKEQIDQIIQAMEGRVVENGFLSGWKSRQPKREDNSAERAKHWREEQKRKTEERNRTQPNTEKRPEEDKEKEEEKKDDNSSAREDVPVDNPDQDKTEALKAVVREYENEIGLITPTISAELINMVDNYPRDWVIDAIKGASLQNIRKMSYIRGTLNNRQNGIHDPPKKGKIIQFTEQEKAKKFAKADCPKCRGTGYETRCCNEEDKPFIPESDWVRKIKCTCWQSADK